MSFGSLATFVYRAQIRTTMADGEVAGTAGIVEESLWATVTTAMLGSASMSR